MSNATVVVWQKARLLVRSEDVEGDARMRAGQVSQGQQRQGKEVAPNPTRPTDRLKPYQGVSSASRADPLMEQQTTYREGGQLWEEGGTERGEVYADAGSWASESFFRPLLLLALLNKKQEEKARCWG